MKTAVILFIMTVLALSMFISPCADICAFTPLKANIDDCCCCEDGLNECDPDAGALALENDGGFHFTYLSPEYQFNKYALMEISDVFYTENLIFSDAEYFIFKHPKA